MLVSYFYPDIFDLHLRTKNVDQESRTQNGDKYFFFWQGLLDRKTCFKFACNVARYVIPDQDVNKCMTNFYMYAREISNMRESLKSPDQKAMFDLEVHGIFCLCDVQDNYSEMFCPN